MRWQKVSDFVEAFQELIDFSSKQRCGISIVVFSGEFSLQEGSHIFLLYCSLAVVKPGFSQFLLNFVGCSSATAEDLECLYTSTVLQCVQKLHRECWVLRFLFQFLYFVFCLPDVAVSDAFKHRSWGAVLACFLHFNYCFCES